MKDIYEILKEISVEIPEDKKSGFDEVMRTNYKTITEVEKLTASRDSYKTQLETAQKLLKEFEGVDVKDLKEKIATLNNDLAKKDTEYQQKIADMEFNSMLDGAIAKSGAKNSKAVKALLDLETLKASKNQADDISKALDTVKSENDYMFKSDEPYQNSQIVGETGGNFGSDSDAAMRAAMGLPPEKKVKLKG